MTLNSFGSVHTEIKLEKVSEYLKVYVTALKKQKFKLSFVDAFAGTGRIQLQGSDGGLLDAETSDRAMEGAAIRALQVNPPFDEYIFIEKERRKTHELAKFCDDFPSLAPRIKIVHEDANKAVEAFCDAFDSGNQRAVVFLDPFGNHVEWRTLKRIAETQGIDLWYLFPAGLGVHRQISKSGHVHQTHLDSLDRLFGTPEWRNEFIEEAEVQDLFGTVTVHTKVTDPDKITDFMIRRMKTIFRGGVLNQHLRLGSRGVHMYSLIFAWSNPEPSARLAGKLAGAVLRSDKVGRRN